MEETKILNIKGTCRCGYTGNIKVPADLSKEEAIEYAKNHLDDIHIEDIDGSDYIPNSDILDEDECDFEED